MLLLTLRCRRLGRPVDWRTGAAASRGGACPASIRHGRAAIGRGSCGGLHGGREVDRPGEEDLAEDDAGDAGVAQATEAVEVANAAGHQDLGIVRPNELPVRAGRRPARAPPWVRTNRRDAGADELADRGRRPSAARPGATGTPPAGPAADRARPRASRRPPRGTPAGRPGDRR